MNEKRDYRSDQIAFMKTKGWFPIPEMAERLMIAPSTLYRWIKDGKVQGKTVGSARYVRIKSVREFIGRDTATDLGI